MNWDFYPDIFHSIQENWEDTSRLIRQNPFKIFLVIFFVKLDFPLSAMYICMDLQFHHILS